MANSTIPPAADALFRAWVNSHAATWEDAATIGLSGGQRAEYLTSSDDLSKKWTDYTAAQAELAKARSAWRDQKAATRDLTMEYLGIIRRYALTQSDPTVVYADADIPAPKVPAEGVPPGQPVELRASLNTQTGNLTLRWSITASTAGISGNIYIIQRRTGASGPWMQVGLTSARSFIDNGVPSAPVVQYQITAQRSNINGLTSQPVNVAFGHGSNGETFIQSVKIAA